MENDQNTTPIKPTTSKFLAIDLESPTCMDLHASRSESPAYIEWDFDVPNVSEHIRSEALALDKELTEGRLIRKRTAARKSKPYPNFKRRRQQAGDTGDITPSKSLSYTHCINQLKEALGERPTATTTTTTTTLDDYKKSSNCSQESDIFDDSLNDCFNLCSQTVEENFYNACVDSSSKMKIDESKKGEFYAKDKTGENSGSSSSNDINQAFDEIDDELFLEVDIN